MPRSVVGSLIVRAISLVGGLFFAGCELTTSLGITAGAVDSAASVTGSEGGSGLGASTEPIDPATSVDAGTTASSSEGNGPESAATSLTDAGEASTTSSGDVGGTGPDATTVTEDTLAASASTVGMDMESGTPPGCVPQPDEPACRTCIKDSCCPEVELCLAVPGCFCTLLCLEDENRPASCDELCVASPEGNLVSSCAAASCSDLCPL